MELTFIGYVQIVLGAMIVVAGTMRHALLLLLFSALMSGSAAILLPALGGASIPPVHFALLFMFLRIVMPGGGTIGAVPDAFRANRWFGLYAFYGIASAFILPRLFAGNFDVSPMRRVGSQALLETVPLEPTAQNLTAAIYLFGALATMLAVWVCCRRKNMAPVLVSGLITMTWLHAVLGITAAIVRDTPADALLEVFRNSTYNQLDVDIGGFVRIRGIFAEASAYATFGFALFVASAELWYRNVRSKATGAAALVMFTVLFFSTSSTAYVGLGVYALVFAIRILALPGIANQSKARTAISASGLAIFLLALAFIAWPALIESVIDVIKEVTVEKSSSESSVQRLFWTMQGWRLFVDTYGIGVGIGSFRSSSLVFAMLGCVGVIGVSTFLVYLTGVFQPWRRSSWGATSDASENIGGALGSAALFSLIPASVSSPSAVPAITFAIFAGSALALRPNIRANRKVEPRERDEFTRPSTNIEFQDPSLGR